MPDFTLVIEDGTSEEIYKILRQSSVDKQHMIADETYTYYHYRPYCHGGLPVFIIGSHNVGVNPAVVGDILSVMVGGVIEAPVQGDNIVLGDTVYAAWDGTTPYLTTDETDTDVECCWGIIIDDQRPIHYGEAVLNSPYDILHSVRMIKPACASIEGRQ